MPLVNAAPDVAGRAAALWPPDVAALAAPAAARAGREERARDPTPGLDHLPEARALALSVHGAELAAWIAARPRPGPGPLVIGLNGGQGSGKSTLAALAATHLQRSASLRTLVLSLDDLYLGRAARRALAARVHPLFETRGVPGTHDTRLGLTLLDALQAAAAGDARALDGLRLPRFDKARDDRVPADEAVAPVTPVDLVLLEGWCVGATAEPEAALREPVNALEAREDPDAVWRRHVNAALAGDYALLFARLDALVMLQVPAWEAVPRWREAQEQVLRQQGRGGMSAAAVARFVAHYERLTRHMLRTLPARADLLLALDEDHAIASVQGR